MHRLLCMPSTGTCVQIFARPPWCLEENGNIAQILTKELAAMAWEAAGAQLRRLASLEDAVDQLTQVLQVDINPGARLLAPTVRCSHSKPHLVPVHAILMYSQLCTMRADCQADAASANSCPLEQPQEGAVAICAPAMHNPATATTIK
jgi:hypothetical protein